MKSFVDLATIKVKAGTGGDGIVAFRREKYVPRGGPSGGNGGKGGGVYLVADKSLATLYDFTHQRVFEAEGGRNGGPKGMTGKSGKDLYLKVPVGTVVKTQNSKSKTQSGEEDRGQKTEDRYSKTEGRRQKGQDKKEQETLADLTEHGQIVLVAKGGRGGLGNAHFKSSTNQAPRFATSGELGDEKELVLELKLIADVGLIGLPNAGKSTLLNALTAARVKVGEYPFTTLHPNLAVTAINRQQIVLADIPGLIEGASQGRGLGDEFLRHIERTKVLLHLIDPLIGVKGQKITASLLAKQAVKNYQTIRQELADYSPSLLQKPEIIVITKIDVTEIKNAFPKIRQQLESVTAPSQTPILAISAANGEGLETVKESLCYVIP